MKNYLVCGVILFCSIKITTCSAQSLDEILNKHYEAIGQKVRSQLNSMFLEVIEVNEQNDEKKYSVILKKPNKIRIEGVWQGQNYISAYDGNRAWTIAPWTGVAIPQLMTFSEIDDIKSKDGVNATIYNSQQNNDEIIYAGLTKTDSATFYLLKISSVENPYTEYYLNVDNYLVYKSLRYSRDDTTQIVEEIKYSNYSKQSFGDQEDITIPMTLEIIRNDSKVELIITEVILGFGTPNSFFTKPD